MTTTQHHSRERGTRMTIAITGSSGLIGSALAESLVADGHAVRAIVRRPPRAASEIAWNPERGEIDRAALEGLDAVVNLAGEPLDQRWTDDAKRRIRESRVRGTSLLANAIAALARPPAVLLSGSAIGIYGDRGDETLDERSTLGSDFLATVCREWEEATRPAEDAGVRVAHLRTGIVLAKKGGALARMLTPFRFGVGGRLGSGMQWMSWIALADAIGALRFLLDQAAVRGAVNLVAPNPSRNAELTEAIGHELHRPSLFPVPKAALRLLLGEMADGAVLASQRVLPLALQRAGYAFRLPTLEQALASILSGG